jgi:hypothetical protein
MQAAATLQTNIHINSIAVIDAVIVSALALERTGKLKVNGQVKDTQLCRQCADRQSKCTFARVE